MHNSKAESLTELLPQMPSNFVTKIAPSTQLSVPWGDEKSERYRVRVEVLRRFANPPRGAQIALGRAWAGAPPFFTVFTIISNFGVWHPVAACDSVWNRNSDNCK
jgi:hypothetical protein